MIQRQVQPEKLVGGFWGSESGNDLARIPGGRDVRLDDRVVDITKRYGDLVANDHVTLRIRRGEPMTPGPQRLRQDDRPALYHRPEHPDDGRVLTDGKDVTEVPTHRRGFDGLSNLCPVSAHVRVRERRALLMIRRVDKAQRGVMDVPADLAGRVR